jgi:uncharacterized GH25 family protein
MKPHILYALALGSVISTTALAHDTWILPSTTTLSGDTPWITFDAAVGNDMFYFNHKALPLDGLTITSPSGQKVDPVNRFKGELRSGFDLQLNETGTYQISLTRSGVSAQWLEEGKPRRWFGDAAELASHVPPHATDLQLQQRSSRIETFVTKGKPSTWQPGVQGLALQAKTHPNDLVSGEAAHFVMLLDGKPLAEARVEIVPEGQRYRDTVNTITATTDTHGMFTVRWPSAGRYWLHADHRGPAAHSAAPATERMTSYSATLEVLP